MRTRARTRASASDACSGSHPSARRAATPACAVHTRPVAPTSRLPLSGAIIEVTIAPSSSPPLLLFSSPSMREASPSAKMCSGSSRHRQVPSGNELVSFRAFFQLASGTNRTMRVHAGVSWASSVPSARPQRRFPAAASARNSSTLTTSSGAMGGADGSRPSRRGLGQSTATNALSSSSRSSSAASSSGNPLSSRSPPSTHPAKATPVLLVFANSVW
mmetsp:Transcript_7158/g.29225  ORF Transcript_7158/g.29225 Transcript_7158/m.29225 type:complete len:217 (+) Transcript_7158:109-759(+)